MNEQRKSYWEVAKPYVWGAVGGAIALAIVGFAGLDWTTKSTAEKMAKTTADTAVVAALVPICVLKFNEQPDAVAKLTELKTVASYQQGKVLEDAGWATIPGGDKPNSAVARKCAETLINATT